MADLPLELFEADWQKQWPVEWGVEIISEASRHLSDELKHGIPSFLKLAGTRASPASQACSHGIMPVCWFIGPWLRPKQKSCRCEINIVRECSGLNWGILSIPTSVLFPRDRKSVV